MLLTANSTRIHGAMPGALVTCWPREKFSLRTHDALGIV
jgi:hypothetical protein